MDDLDHRLIALLRADSRAPTAAIAATLKVSRGTVQNRIDRLRASGVLLGFTIGRMAQVQRALSGVPTVTATHTTNGRWDLVAELEAADLPAFSAALDSIRAIDGIAATETSLLLKTTRF